MKLYIVYFRTMQDSPSVQIVCATYDKALAESKYAEAKAWEDAFMENLDEDDSDWAEACIRTFDLTEDRKSGDTIYLLIETLWHEEVTTDISAFLYECNAVATQSFRKEDISKDYPGIAPFEEDETFDQACHLSDDSVMVDYWTYVEPVVL